MPKPLEGPAPYSDAWYALRYFDEVRKIPVTIGASEAAAAIGLSEYETPLHIYLRKRRRMADKEETERMKMGKLFEPVIVQVYAEQIGLKVQPAEHMLHLAENPCISATPDATVYQANGVPFVMDAKCATIRIAHKWGEEHTDEIPDDYLIQGQQQMLVSDTDRCDFAVLMDGLVRRYTVRRNDRLIKMLRSSLEELIERIIEGNPPEPNWKHPKTHDLMKAIYGVNPALEKTLAQEDHLAWEKYQSLGETVSALKKERDALQARVLHAMGDAGTARFPGVSDKYLSRVEVNIDAREQKAYSYIRLSEKKIKEKK